MVKSKPSMTATAFDNQQSYWISHRPGNPLKRPDEVATADNIVGSGIFPSDFLDHPEWYLTMGDRGSKETVGILRKIQGHPEALVTVYRGSPRGELNQGDWVTLSRSYAEEYAGDSFYADRSGNAKVFSYEVKAGELSFDGDDISEFGYWGRKKKAR